MARDTDARRRESPSHPEGGAAHGHGHPGGVGTPTTAEADAPFDADADPGQGHRDNHDGTALATSTAADHRKKRRPELTPTQRAIGLLTRREHSRRELARKLQAKGVTREDADQAIERLAGAGWQDDTRFARALARMRANAGYGPLHIRAELGTHGLDAATVADALDALAEDIDWRESARDLVRRRFGAPSTFDLAKRRKAADFLLRRGFDHDAMRAAIRIEHDD